MILLRAASLRPSVSHTRALDLDDSLSLGLKMGGAGEGQPRLSLLRWRLRCSAIRGEAGAGWPMWFWSQPKVQILLFSFYLTFIWLWSLLGPGFGPGLDNIFQLIKMISPSPFTLCTRCSLSRPGLHRVSQMLGLWILIFWKETNIFCAHLVAELPPSLTALHRSLPNRWLQKSPFKIGQREEGPEDKSIEFRFNCVLKAPTRKDFRLVL